jgi:hypothetical protein
VLAVSGNVLGVNVPWVIVLGISVPRDVAPGLAVSRLVALGVAVTDATVHWCCCAGCTLLHVAVLAVPGFACATCCAGCWAECCCAYAH